MIDGEGNPVLDGEGNPVVELKEAMPRRRLVPAARASGRRSTASPRTRSPTTAPRSSSRARRPAPATRCPSRSTCGCATAPRRRRCDLPAGDVDARFEGASVNGSRVIVRHGPADRRRERPRRDRGPLRLRHGGRHGELLTGGGAEGAKLEGVTAIANDASKVFFVANAALATGATEGQHNLYVRDLAADRPRSSRPSPTADVGGLRLRGPGAERARCWPAAPTWRAARSRRADGSVLAFVSGGNLTGGSDTGYGQVYRYVTATGALDCVSCPAANRRPARRRSVAAPAAPPPGRRGHVGQRRRQQRSTSRPRTGWSPATPTATPRRRAASSATTGSRHDVYEWNAGTVTLLSSGRSPAPSDARGRHRGRRETCSSTPTSALVAQDLDGEGGHVRRPRRRRLPRPAGRPGRVRRRGLPRAARHHAVLPDPRLGAVTPGPATAPRTCSTIPITVGRRSPTAQRRKFARTGQDHAPRARWARPAGSRWPGARQAPQGRRGAGARHGEQARQVAGTVRVPVKLSGAARRRCASGR